MITINKIFIIFLILFLTSCSYQKDSSEKEKIIEMVNLHATAWSDGDINLLDSLLSDDVIFAYPGRRLNKTQTIEDLSYFKEHYNDTQVYINKIMVDGNDLAVEWQFATTNIDTGQRQVVSDAIMARVEAGKFTVWKEYLDGRVKSLQASDELFLEEGEEPYPWPLKTAKYGMK